MSIVMLKPKRECESLLDTNTNLFPSALSFLFLYKDLLLKPLSYSIEVFNFIILPLYYLDLSVFHVVVVNQFNEKGF